MWTMNMTLDKFIAKARKAGVTGVRLTKGTFEYCDYEAQFKGPDAYYIRVNAGKIKRFLFIKEKLDFFAQTPTRDTSEKAFNDEYVYVMIRVLDEGLTLYDYATRN